MNIAPIRLPTPEREGGKSVLAALRLRRTVREISEKPLPLQTLSNLLWAAAGINRRQASFDRTGRTAGSASNSQEISLYVATPEGVYLYEPEPHQLTPVAEGDHRALATWNGIPSAPVHIFYVVDLTRFWTGPGQPDPHISDPEVQKSYYYVDTGLIAQNVYLFAASQGLVSWFHNCHTEAAAKSAWTGAEAAGAVRAIGGEEEARGLIEVPSRSSTVNRKCSCTWTCVRSGMVCTRCPASAISICCQKSSSNASASFR